MGNNETEKADDRESLKVMGVGGFCISSLSHFLGLAILVAALIPLLFSRPSGRRYLLTPFSAFSS